MKKWFSFITLSLLLMTTGCNNTGGYIVTESGLKYKDVVAGEGEAAQSGDTLSMHYIGTLEDGTQFDSSRDRGKPFTFVLGAGQVIAGWDEGVAGMKIGGKRELMIPSALGYGENGIPGVIPGGATLIFQVELMEIEE